MPPGPLMGIIYVPIWIGTPMQPINANNQPFTVAVALGALTINGSPPASTTVTLTPYVYDPANGSLTPPDLTLITPNTPQSYTFSGSPAPSVVFSFRTGANAANSQKHIVFIASNKSYAVSGSMPVGYPNLPTPVNQNSLTAPELHLEGAVIVPERPSKPS